MTREYSAGKVVKGRKSWRGVLTWRDENNERHRITKTLETPCSSTSNRGKTTAEAELRHWREELMAKEEQQEIEAGYITPENTISFVEYCELYVSYKRKLGDVTSRTLKGYRSHINAYKKYDFGQLAMYKITPEVIINWMEELSKDYSAVTRAHHYTFAKQVCQYAFNTGVIRRNPFNDPTVKPPKRTKRPINALDQESIFAVIKQLDSMKLTPFVLSGKIGLQLGLRREEVCALRWCDIDFRQQVMHITHAFSKGETGWIFWETKTNKGTRDIPLPKRILDDLAKRKEDVRHTQEELGVPWSEDFFVVGSPVEVKAYNPDTLTHDWSAFARSNNIKGTQNDYVTFHDLRHTFASASVAAGGDIASITSIGGWAKPSMLLDIYADAYKQSKVTAMDLTAKFMYEE